MSNDQMPALILASSMLLFLIVLGWVIVRKDVGMVTACLAFLFMFVVLGLHLFLGIDIGSGWAGP